MQLSKSLQINELHQYINVEIIEGNYTTVTGINEIHKVTVGDITFVDHPKYYEKALNSMASFILINNKEVQNPKNKTLLFCADPFKAYNHLTQLFSPFNPINQCISPTATIGTNTVIMPGAIIGNDVSIGNNCIIYPNVVIYNNTVIKNNVIIQANTTIGADAFYFQKRADGYHKWHSCGKVIIEDNVEIGAGCTIDKGVSGDTIIGEGTKFDNHIHIGHGVVIGKHCLFAGQVGVGGKTIIGNNVILWGQVGVSKDLSIGDNAVVLAQSGVSKSLPGNTTYFGSPARVASEMMREMASVRQLPKIIKQLQTPK